MYLMPFLFLILLPVSISAQITTTLTPGEAKEEVSLLQRALNLLGKTVAPSPNPGSLNNETNYYGSLTASAVRALQCDYGIVCEGNPTSTGWGQVGPKTRSLLNSLWGQISYLYEQAKDNFNPGRQTASISGSGSGLIAHYTFDEGSGSTTSDSAGSNNGTLQGNPTWTTGKVGSGSLKFDGNQSIELPNPSGLQGLSEMTVAVWAQTDIPNGTTNRRVIEERGAGDDPFELGL